MAWDGEHYICIKHDNERYFSPAAKGWVCVECETEKN